MAPPPGPGVLLAHELAPDVPKRRSSRKAEARHSAFGPEVKRSMERMHFDSKLASALLTA